MTSSLAPASCRTINIGAKYLLEVQWAFLLAVVTKEFTREPLFLSNLPFHHDIMQSYHNHYYKGQTKKPGLKFQPRLLTYNED